MNFKQFGVLLSISIVIGINVITTKALTKEQPSIQFGQAIGSGGCNIQDNLAGSDGRSLLIFLDNMVAKDGKRQRCLLRVNTIIPSGFQVQDVEIVYEGSTEINPGSSGTSLSRSYAFVGGAYGIVKAPPAITQFTSTNLLFQEQDNLTVASASCGGQWQLGINIIVQSSEGSFIIVEPAGLAGSGVKMHFSIATC